MLRQVLRVIKISNNDGNSIMTILLLMVTGNTAGNNMQLQNR